MKTLKQYKKYILGRTVEYYSKNHDDGYRFNHDLGSSIVVGFTGNTDKDDMDISSIKNYNIGCYIVTEENYLLRAYIQDWYCSGNGNWYYIIIKNNKLTIKQTSELKEKSIKFNEWLFHSKHKGLVELNGIDKWNCNVDLGLEYDFDYLNNKKYFDHTKCLNKNNTDIVNKITVLNRIPNDGNSINENILLYHEYDVDGYEVVNNQIIGYYIKHSQDKHYVPKECLTENDNKDFKFEELIKKYEDSLGGGIPMDIKNLLISNFRNEYELNILKMKNEISNIRFYNIDNTIKDITENVKDLNRQTSDLYRIVKENYKAVNEKIDKVEEKMKKSMETAYKSLQEQIDVNYVKANNYRLYGVWCSNDELTKITKSGLKNMVKDESNGHALSDSEYKKIVESFQMLSASNFIDHSDYTIRKGEFYKR